MVMVNFLQTLDCLVFHWEFVRAHDDRDDDDHAQNHGRDHDCNEYYDRNHGDRNRDDMHYMDRAYPN